MSGASNVPECGEFHTTGGPDAAGDPGNGYWHLGEGVGNAHAGFIKTNNAPEENFVAENAFTMSLQVYLTSKGSIATFFTRKFFEYRFGGVAYGDSGLCMDVMWVDDGPADCNPGAAFQVPFDGVGEWVNWVARFDGNAGTYTIFRNGVKVGERTGITGTIGASAALMEVGSVNTWGADIGVDDLQVWDSALSDAEILTLATCKVPDGISGEIWADDHHLSIPKGALGTSTIHWDTSGIPVAEIWASADGGAEVLFAQVAGGPGQADAPWIQPYHSYVFRLYKGTSHTSLLAWTSVTTQYSPASMLGFNYWPAGCDTSCLNDAEWISGGKSAVAEADLDHIASLSGGVLRLLIWPQTSGWDWDPNTGNALFTADLQQQSANLVDLVRMCKERDLQVVIAFGNNYFDSGNGTLGHRWWQNQYTNDPAGFTSFLGDTRYWMNTFVDAIEGSAHRDAVAFYDYQNEWSQVHPYAGWYATYLYDWSSVPQGKRGFSVHTASSDAAVLDAQLDISPPGGVARRLDFVDYHSYPTLGANPNIESAFDTVQNLFPHSTVILGEYGAPAANPSEEATQVSTVLDVAQRAISKGIPYHQHWMLWDYAPPASNQTVGWGYSENAPKDVLGEMSSFLNLLLNPDMELFTGGEPDSWDVAGTGPATLASVDDGTAATNARHAQVTMSASSGSVWMASRLTPVQGGRKLYINSFIRSDMTNVHMSVTEYDANSNSLGSTSAPALSSPNSTSFENYLQDIGAWHVQLQATTRYVIVAIGGDSTGSQSFLDVDAVSAWER